MPGTEQASESAARRILAAAATTVYVDAVHGSDTNPGTLQSPVKTAARGLELSRAAASKPVAVAFREGLYRLENTLELTGQDNGTSLVAYPGEQPILSGARLLHVKGGWSKYKVSPAGNATFQVYQATNSVYGATPSPTGPVYNFTRTPDAAGCEAVCRTFRGPGSGDACTSFTWHDSTWPLEYKDTCWIRTDGEWDPVPDHDHTAGRVVQQPAMNVWKATVTPEGGVLNATQRVRALVVDAARRGIRARFPNADPETTRFPQGWIPKGSSWQWQSEAADLHSTDVTTYNLSAHGGYPTGMFSQYWMGAGGPCERYNNNQSYWCQPNVRLPCPWPHGVAQIKGLRRGANARAAAAKVAVLRPLRIAGSCGRSDVLRPHADRHQVPARRPSQRPLAQRQRGGHRELVAGRALVHPHGRPQRLGGRPDQARRRREPGRRGQRQPGRVLRGAAP